MSAMILLHATKKSATSVGGRSWSRPAFDLLSQRSSDGVSRSFSKRTGSSRQLQQRALFSTKAIDKSDTLLARSKQTPPLVSPMVQHCNYNDEGNNGNTMISRVPPGNPTTMAFMSRSSGSTSSSRPMGIRNKSSGAAFSRQSDEDDDNNDDVVAAGDSSNGIAGGGSMANKSQYESWMANLNRGTDNTWLSKPRTVEWYTGLQPTVCPGSDEHGVLRSLPLPNLSNVTRQGTKDYFDNSWTLFEMMFAGLKGEDPFYRYVNNRLFVCFQILCCFAIIVVLEYISESTLLFVCHDQSMNEQNIHTYICTTGHLYMDYVIHKSSTMDTHPAYT